MKPRAKFETSDSAFHYCEDVCCWDRMVDNPQSVFTLRTQRLYGGEVLLSHILLCCLSGSTQTFSCYLQVGQQVKCNWYECQPETLSDTRGGSLLRSHKPPPFFVQEQTQAGGVFLMPLARMTLRGVWAAAPSTAEVVCESEALKNRLAA